MILKDSLSANSPYWRKSNKMVIQKHKYKFKPYSNKFKKLYNLENNRLKKILPNYCKLEHIGSTAVLGLGGKGIIDVLLGAPKNKINRIKKILQKNDYVLSPSGGDKDRLFLYKDYGNNKTRRVHIHLTFHDSFKWNSPIAVREYLREHKKAAQEYACIKRKGSKICKGIGQVYRKHKEDFLKKLEKLALKEYNKGGKTK